MLLALPLRALAALGGARLDPPRRAALARAAALRLGPADAAAEAAIDALRGRLAASDEALEIEDFGAGTRGALGAEAKPPARRVADVYARAAARPAWGRLLFGLARHLRPARVLELGTNLGVSAAHLAAALRLNAADAPDGPAGAGHLVTLEGDPGLAARARAHLAALGLAAHATVVTGRFDDTLGDVLVAHGPFDLVFIDGHHEDAAARRYYGRIRPHLAPGACVVFDDVEPTRPVRRAWRAVRAAEPDAVGVDLVKLGLLFLPVPAPGRRGEPEAQAARPTLAESPARRPETAPVPASDPAPPEVRSPAQ